MYKPCRFLLAGVLSCALVTTAFGQMFEIKQPPANIKPGINKIPPLMPVMSPGEFQSQVKTLSQQTQQNMMNQGMKAVQTQRNALPTDPNATPEKPNKPGSQNTSATPPEGSTTPTEETPPTSETESTSPPAEESSPQGSSSGTSAPASHSQPSSGGQLNVRY